MLKKLKQTKKNDFLSKEAHTQSTPVRQGHKLQSKMPCYQQTPDKQRLLGCDKLKIDLTLAPAASTRRGGLITAPWRRSFLRGCRAWP